MTDVKSLQHVAKNNQCNHCKSARVEPRDVGKRERMDEIKHSELSIYDQAKMIISNANIKYNAISSSVNNKLFDNEVFVKYLRYEKEIIEDMRILMDKISTSSEEEKCDLLEQLQRKFEELTAIEKKITELFGEDVHEGDNVASDLRGVLNTSSDISERYYEEASNLATNAMTKPDKMDEKRIIKLSDIIARSKKTAIARHQSLESLQLKRPKLFAGLGVLIKKSEKLLDKLKELSSKINEFKKKYFRDKSEEQKKDSENDALSKDANEPDSNANLSNSFIENLIENENIEKEEKRKKLDKKAAANKRKDKEEELLFEKIMLEKKYQISSLVKP